MGDVMGQQKANDNSGFDWGLRERVTESFDQFLKTLDATLSVPEPEALDALRDDANHVMRAIARVRLEIERLAEEQDH
jgi:hypothetical protein